MASQNIQDDNINALYIQVRQNIDENMKKFLRPFYYSNYQGARENIIKIKPDDKPHVHYTKILQMLLGAACHSGETFFKKFFLDPNLIKD